MKRWVIAAFFVVVPALFLLHLPERQKIVTEEAPIDEILAYELPPSGSVTVTVPGGLDALLVTTWAIVPSGIAVAPDFRQPYAFELAVTNAGGREFDARTYHIESRISEREGEEGLRAPYAARLADSDDRVTDSRTTALDRSETLSRGGFLRIRNVAGTGPVLLARLAFRDPRGVLARAVGEASLGADARRRLVADRASLGFVDLAEPARRNGLLNVGTRLTAAGREGVDYTLRRLLLGDYRGSLVPAPRRDLGFDVSAFHSAALNFGAPVLLRFVAPAHGKLYVREGEAAERALETGETGALPVMMSGDKPRSVVIRSESPTDVRVRCIVDRQGARAELGDVRALLAGEGQFEIGEDVNVARFVRLDPGTPVVVGLLPGQTMMRVMVRGALPGSEAMSLPASVEARFVIRGGAAEESTSFRATLPRSKFERWRGANDATDSYSETLGIPEGVREVRLYGDPRLFVKIFVPEPDVFADELKVPYRIALGDREVWRNAPYDIRVWAPITPANDAELTQANRAADLLSQVRIEPEGAFLAAEKRPERLLSPEGAPVRRRLLVPATYSPGAPMPPDGWSAATPGRELQVDATGPRAGRVEITYRAEEGKLGQSLRLLVDGVDVAHQTLVVASGTMRANVAAGRHRIELDGLGANGTAYVDAAPAGGGPIVRRRDVYELDHRRPLELRIEQKPDEILHLVLFVATESMHRPYRFRYAVDDGHPPRKSGRFFRVGTIAKGETSGRSGELARGLLWEAAGPAPGPKGAFPHGISWGKIHLGDDLRGGTRIVTLSLDPLSDPIWVRAVLVGQPESAKDADTRVWAVEAL